MTKHQASSSFAVYYVFLEKMIIFSFLFENEWDSMF